MTPRELELYIERLKRAQEMIETNDIGQFQEKIMEVKSYLEQFNGLQELLKHMKAISEIAYTIKEFYTIDEASKYLGLSKSTVYKITSNRELTYYKPNGKSIFIKRDDLLKWINRHPVRSMDEINAIAATKAHELAKEHKRKSNRL